MQWLRLISLRKQKKSADELDAAIKSVDSTQALFDDLRQTLRDIQIDVHERAAKVSTHPPAANRKDDKDKTYERPGNDSSDDLERTEPDGRAAVRGSGGAPSFHPGQYSVQPDPFAGERVSSIPRKTRTP